MRRARRLSLAVGFLVLAWTGTAGAATIKVNTTLDDLNQGDGQCSLRKAIEDVNSPGSSQTDCAPAAFGANTIVLDAMRYQLGPVPAASELTIAPTVTNLTIEGAGEGLTTIDASGIFDRAFDVSAGATVTITGVTISGGQAFGGMGSSAGQSGGGILNAGTLTITDSAVINNGAGGGSFAAGGSSSTSGAGAAGAAGSAGGSGGGIYNTGTLVLNGVTIGGNHAGDGGPGGFGGQGTSGGAGGAGGAGGEGGGIANVGGTLTVRDSTVRGNTSGAGGTGGSGGSGSSAAGGPGGAGGPGATGGGIANDGGSLTVINSTVASNDAGAGGAGGPAGPGASASAGGNGGAGAGGGGVADISPQSASITNVTAAGNDAGAAGAGGNAGSTGGIAGAPGAAGIAGGVLDTGSTTTLQNTLLALNGGGNCSGSLLDGGNNLSFGDSSCPATFSTGDPNLGALEDNGGPAPTISLGPGSAAIDQIPATGAGCPADDERGVPRPSGSKCDIGAYEVAPPVTVTGAAGKPSPTAINLAGSVIANAGAGTVTFQYGRTTRYGSTSGTVKVGGVTPMQVSIRLAHLKPRTTYHYRLVAVTMDGSSFGVDRTFTTSLSPVITRLRIAPSAFRAAAGATLTYSDSRAARAAFVVLRCVKSSGHRCTRYSTAERFAHRDAAGRNRVPFGGHRLRPGSYLLDATPRANGRTGPTVSTPFRIVG